MIRDLYITVTITRKSYKEAESYFARTGSEYTLALSRLGSRCTELDMMDRLRILHGFFRHGEEADFHFDPKLSMKLGHSFKDYICPDSFEFDRDCFRMGRPLRPCAIPQGLRRLSAGRYSLGAVRY